MGFIMGNKPIRFSGQGFSQDICVWFMRHDGSGLFDELIWGSGCNLNPPKLQKVGQCGQRRWRLAPYDLLAFPKYVRPYDELKHTFDTPGIYIVQATATIDGIPTMCRQKVLVFRDYILDEANGD